MQTIFRCTLLIAFVVMDSACAPSPPDIRRLDDKVLTPKQIDLEVGRLMTVGKVARSRYCSAPEW